MVGDVNGTPWAAALPRVYTAVRLPWLQTNYSHGDCFHPSTTSDAAMGRDAAALVAKTLGWDQGQNVLGLVGSPGALA